MTDDYTSDNINDEWEEDINPEEVERVVDHLEQLMETVESDSVHELLTEAYEKIEALVDWEDDEDGDMPQADAA